MVLDRLDEYGIRPSPSLICFIDTMRAEGHGVESIRTVLRGQGLQIAPRNLPILEQ